MKHRLILEEIERCLNTIPGLRVERDRRQPVGDEELEAGPLAILLSNERETADVGNKSSLTWARRWELKPIVSVSVREADPDVQREILEDIEDAFITALEDSRLNEDDLLAGNTGPDFKTAIRNPDESDLAGMEMYLNLVYDR